jgi:hypothetical protein
VIFVFATTQVAVIVFGVGVLVLGFLLALSWNSKSWPFGVQAATSGNGSAHRRTPLRGASTRAG